MFHSAQAGQTLSETATRSLVTVISAVSVLQCTTTRVFKVTIPLQITEKSGEQVNNGYDYNL